MTVLTRPRFIPQMRLDLEDLEVWLNALRSDSKFEINRLWSADNHIVKGFNVSGLGGANTVSVNLTEATLLAGASTCCFSWWTADNGASPVNVLLNPNQKNYLEIELVDVTGTPLTRAFWDQTLRSGEGGEFNQIVDTVETVSINIVALSGGFSGSPDRIKLAIVETDINNIVNIILDQRELFFRLGTPTDPENEFNWGTKAEPSLLINLDNLSGTFEVDEEVTFGTSGATAKVVEVNPANIRVILLSNFNITQGETITGGTSGATAELDTAIEDFTGGDKNITNIRELIEALQTEIKYLKGSDFWFEDISYSSDIRGVPGESLVARVGTLTDAVGDAQEDRSAYLRSDDRVTWTGSQLEFSQDIVLEILNTKDGSLTEHIIELADSPLALADGESLWVQIDRLEASETLVVFNTAVDPIPAQEQATKDIFVLFRRLDNPLSGDPELYLPFSKSFLRPGQSIRLGAGGGGSAVIKATFLDPVSTALPAGATVNIDGVAGADGDTVLFTNLALDNNKIYELSGVGVAIAWSPVSAFPEGEDPTDGDSVRILQGEGFADQLAVFDGTNFKVNDVVRYFDGADYWEQSSLKTSDITSNTTGSIFEVELAGSENWIIDYAIIRSTSKETGTFIITSDGTDVNFARYAANLADVGVQLFADNNAGDLRFRYTADVGSNGIIKFFSRRWSNAAGGPGGVPSYSGSSSSSVLAAGNITEIQYNGPGGNLAADSDFTWNDSTKRLSLGDLNFRGIQGNSTLNDAQAAPANLINLDNTLMKFAVIEYSVERDTETRTGRMLVCHNGTVAVLSDDHVNTGGAGIDGVSIVFSAIISGGSLLIRYTTDSTGDSGIFKYSIREWN